MNKNKKYINRVEGIGNKINKVIGYLHIKDSALDKLQKGDNLTKETTLTMQKWVSCLSAKEYTVVLSLFAFPIVLIHM